MATRKIKVLSTVGVSGTIETNVTSLGELKPLLRQREINISGMKMMVGETRNELNLDDAVLPEGDFKLYLMPAKTKSGGDAADTCRQIASLFSTLASQLSNSCACNSGAKASPVAEVDSDVEDLRNLAGGFSSDVEEEEEDSWLQ